MTISSYAELQTAMSNWLVRADTTMTDRFPEFIANFEAWFARECQLRLMMERDTDATFSTEYTALPTGFREMRSLKLLSANGRTISLKGTSIEWIDDNVTTGYTGVPKYYAINGSEVRVAPPPDGTYTAEMSYITFPGLATTDPNWLLTKHPDIYLYGSLTEAAPFMIDETRGPVWEGERDKRVAQLKVAEKRAQFSGSVMAVRSDLALGRMRGSNASG